MIVTTSRKPSRRTRSFVKAFCRFLDWKYIQRGKLSLKDFELDNLCIISEIKGNPAVMEFYFGGKKTLKILFSVSNVKKVELSRGEVLFVGEKFNFFGSVDKRMLEKFDERPYFEKRIVERGNELFFYFKKELVFKMRISAIKRIQQSL